MFSRAFAAVVLLLSGCDRPTLDLNGTDSAFSASAPEVTEESDSDPVFPEEAEFPEETARPTETDGPHVPTDEPVESDGRNQSEEPDPTPTDGAGGTEETDAGQGPPCSDGQLCGSQQPCDPTFGCIECRDISDCDDGTALCAFGQCVAGCNEEDDCRDEWRRHCDEERGICVECEGNYDCAEYRPFCDERLGVCVECFDNGDCYDHPEELRVCVQFRCQQCRDDHDCSAFDQDRQSCDTETHECVVCVNDYDCFDEFGRGSQRAVCEYSECVPCSDFHPCLPGSICVDGACEEDDSWGTDITDPFSPAPSMSSPVDALPPETGTMMPPPLPPDAGVMDASVSGG